MTLLPKSLEALTESFAKLPSIGPKSAARHAYFLAGQDDATLKAFAAALIGVADKVHSCASCGFFAEEELCGICKDSKRDETLLCIVEHSLDVVAIENTSVFRGKYFVLGGALSPIDGVGPEDLHIPKLLNKVKKSKVSEVILALDPDVPGESTSHYLNGKLTAMGVKTTKLATGLPAGGDLQYIDALTLDRAFRARHSLEG